MGLQLPGTGPQAITDRFDVHRLVTYLRSESRTRPVVLLTVARGRHDTYVQPGDFTADGRADVITLTHDQVTYALSDAVGKEASVFGGACRVYPPGTQWATDPHTVPLFLARDPREIKDLKSRLLEALRRALTPQPAAAQPTPGRSAAPGARTPVAGASPSRPGSPSTPQIVRTADDAHALAAHLRSGERRLPVAVVSRATGTTEAYADVAELRASLQGIADVTEIETNEASWAFSDAVPKLGRVYGGASRVYPIGTGWESDPYSSPLRFAYGRFDRVRVTRELISDAMGMAGSGGFVTATPDDSAAVPIRGVVKWLAGERALVDVSGSMPCTVWPELVEPGMSAEALFRIGMPVHGLMDPATRRLDVRDMRRTAESAVGAYGPGDTVLARVSAVDASGCTVELFPGHAERIPADLVHLDLDPRALFIVGEVVPVWVGARDDTTGEWLLSLIDAGSPEEAVTAPSILDGGPPWLDPGQAGEQMVAVEPEEEPEPTVEPVALPEATADVVEALTQEKAQLVEEVLGLRQALAAAHASAKELRREIREASKKRSRSRPSLPDERLFTDPGEQLDFEIRWAWALAVGAAEKARYPLTPWRYGPDFFASLDSVEGVSRAKVVEVIVQVLTGRAPEVAARELHQLRTGLGGDDPPVVREHGSETCWRVSLQVNSPSARRLHFWRCADGAVELSGLRLHDDFRP